MQRIEERQIQLNTQLADKLKDQGITRVSLTSYGNSIASGYSMARSTIPLLLRNKTLSEIFAQKDIKVEKYNFARAQNNSDEHLYEWLLKNIREQEIIDFSRADYNPNSKIYMHTSLSEEDFQKYYQASSNNRGLRDVILEDQNKLLNVVVYSGCTGSFLDNITREGKLTEMLTFGIKRDTKSLEAILKLIHTSNRSGESNTQVYLLGAPNFLGLGISEIINRKLKKIAKEYPNVVYIPPIKSRFIYHDIETDKLTPDIHYDETEYLQLNNNIIESINENYNSVKSLISLDRAVYKLNGFIEFGNQSSSEGQKVAFELLSKLVEQELSKLATEEEKVAFLQQAKEYLLSRTPYDFHYIGKKNIKKM